MASPVKLDTLAKVAGLFSAGVFTGYTWSLSRAAIPAILDHDPDRKSEDSTVLSQWRSIYIDGFYVSRPFCFVSFGCFAFLACLAPRGTIVQILYTIAALLTSSGPPYALTLLRTTNSALAIRSRDTLGPYDGKEFEPLALRYANRDVRTITRVRDPVWTNQRLVERWCFHNMARSVILAVGTLVAACAVVLDA